MRAFVFAVASSILLTGCPEKGPNFYEDGKRAFRSGVPANANPALHSQYDATQWLNGWMDEAESRKVK